ncbi:MAG: PP2C family protein-serine/threonine phosphatase [Tetrasphaera sp.]
MRQQGARWRHEWRRFLGAGLSVRARLYLVLLAVTVAGAGYLSFPDHFPRSVFVPCVLLAGLFLPPGPLLVSFGYVWCFLTVGTLVDAATRGQALVSFLVVSFGMAVMYLLSSSRAALGLSGFSGDRMLADLRARQRALAQLPPLPEGWRAECQIAGAYGDSFSGDFLLCSPGRDGHEIEVVLVDVSGQGSRAGTRSLMLSSALSGLLGQVASDRFLAAANSFLVRERWREGFATAVHVALDLRTGRFVIGSAGHPPAIHYKAETGRWEAVLSRPGPVLGVMADMEFPQTIRELAPGDALLLYTDGVIESRTNQLADGIDWMLGTIEHMGGAGFPGVASTLVGDAQGGLGDDRAVLLIWRE